MGIVAKLDPKIIITIRDGGIPITSRSKDNNRIAIIIQIILVIKQNFPANFGLTTSFFIESSLIYDTFSNYYIYN